MAFEATHVGYSVFGNKRVHWGTYTNAGGDSGGDIDTGLRLVDFIYLQTGTAVSSDQSAVVETMPCDGSAVTIATTAGADGFWWAFGY